MVEPSIEAAIRRADAVLAEHIRRGAFERLTTAAAAYATHPKLSEHFEHELAGITKNHPDRAEHACAHEFADKVRANVRRKFG